MRRKGSRFTLGNRSQPCATVRNRPRDPRMAVPIISSAKRGHFWRFHMWRCFGFAWHTWHFVTFRRVGNVSKVVLCGRRNTLVSFSQDELQFSWQAQHFGRVHFNLRGRRSLAYFLRIALAGRRQVATRCKWHFMRCDEN